MIMLWVEIKFPIQSYRDNLIILWVKVVLFTGCVWASRMSIAMSIARVAPAGRISLRRHAYLILIFFTSIAVGLITWVGVECTSSKAWFNQHMHQCQVSNALGTSILASHALIDLFLVITPLVLFWRIHLPRRQRKLILGGFAASIFSSIITAFHMAFQFSTLNVGGHRWDLVLFFGHIETTVTLFLCNFLILVAAVYKVCRRWEWRSGTSARSATTTGTSISEADDGAVSDPFTSATRTWPFTSSEVYALTEISDLTYDSSEDVGGVDDELDSRESQRDSDAKPPELMG